MKVSSILYIMKIMWWGLKRILSNSSKDILKSAKNQNLQLSCTWTGGDKKERENTKISCRHDKRSYRSHKQRI